MRIGELATRAGVNIQTIRFYERRKILQSPSRSAPGYRQYAASDLNDLCVIHRCKELGFTLKDIQQLLRLHRATASPRQNARHAKEFRQIVALGRRRLEQIEQKLRDLRSMRMELFTMLDRVDTVGTIGCPAIPSRKS
jgi:DNA-binding transcriptional MerR regulator